MTVPIFFALIGGVILLGFLANLLFRVTKIPSVLLLMAIGVVLGPVTGLVTSASLFEIAPFFGTLALLIILFEGGLELDIMTVAKEAPRTTLLAVSVFVLSVGVVMLFTHFVLNMSLLNSLLIAAVLGATSPAICIPVVQGLSVRNEIKTIAKLESALGDVLLIVSVLLLIDVHHTGNQDTLDMMGSFVVSFGVAFVISSIAGVLWSRLIGWMGHEPLAYMLTLGFMFLLYFIVEELHGSAAIAVLMFGLILENMEVVAHRFSDRIRHFFGIDIKADKFILNQFMKHITEEISFLVRTFFFVYLGLLMDFRALSWTVGFAGAGMVVLLLFARWIVLRWFANRHPDVTRGEFQVLMAMMPRGLATAVMAFLPMDSGVPGTEMFTMYAFIAIVLTNVFMTVRILFAERRLKREQPVAPSVGRVEPEPFAEQQEPVLPWGSAPYEHPAEQKPAVPLFAPSLEFSDEPEPASFSDWFARSLGMHRGERETKYIDAIKASFLFEPLFWMQVLLAAAITTLGLLLNQSAIIIGGAIIMPILWPMLGSGLALAVGDMYLLMKLLVKLLLMVIFVVLLSALFSDILPFSDVTAEIASRTRPSLIDFLLAFFSGMAGAALHTRTGKVLEYLPGAIVAITVLPPLCVIGFGFAHDADPLIIRGAALLATANFFANILGAMVIFLLVGMQAAVSATSIRTWKQQELERPLVQFLFTRLRLLKLIGRTGTIRARIIVTVVFLAAVLLPLRTVLDQLGLEFRARQAITDMEKAFVIPDRSTILNTSSFIDEDGIDVRLQVATNQFFTSEDITLFEQRVSDRTGLPTRLDLVQTLSDIRKGTSLRGAVAGQPAQRSPLSFSDLVSSLRSEIRTILLDVPVPRSLEILSLNAELTSDTLSPVLHFHYFSDEPLSEDAQDLMGSLIASRVKIPKRGVQFSWYPREYTFATTSPSLSKEHRIRIRNLQSLMKKYPQIFSIIEVAGSTRSGGERLLELLKEDAPLLVDSIRSSVDVMISRNSRISVVLTTHGLVQ